MPKTTLRLLLIYFIVSGCKKSQPDSCEQVAESSYYKAKIELTSDASCGLPLLNFTEDSARIIALTGQNALLYTVTGLPNNLNSINRLLHVTAVAPTVADEIPCSDFGIAYPRLKINCAKGR